MNKVRIDTEHLRQYVTDAELQQIAGEVLAAKKTLLAGNGKGNDFLGWVNLPDELDPAIVASIKNDVARLAPKIKLFVVIGIGGSYLGARAVIEALQSEFAAVMPSQHPYVVYAGHTLSEDYYHQLLALLDGSDYAVAVISKSGTTTEPAVAFRIVKAHLEAKYGDIAENPALYYAALRNILYRKGRKVEMLVNFLPNLKYISEWWKQLYGESEGKDHKGILPHSLSFTTDLHSMGQYVQDGERLMFETFISVDKPATSVAIPADEQNLDGINYLLGKSLNEINHNAELGTMIAHRGGGVPVLKIEVPKVDEYILGQLIYFFEFACGVSGYTLGVNPFDQPGVEAYKKNMFILLGKPGYEGQQLV